MPEQPLYRIVSRVYETGGPGFPVVEHIFNGRTYSQALAFFRAHLRSDSFLRSCLTTGYYTGFSCREEHSCHRFEQGQWVMQRCLIDVGELL